MAVLLKLGGGIDSVELSKSKKERGVQLALAVGGTPEYIDIPSGGIVVINKEQVKSKRKLNKAASAIFTGRGEIFGEAVYIPQREKETDN